MERARGKGWQSVGRVERVHCAWKNARKIEQKVSTYIVLGFPGFRLTPLLDLHLLLRRGDGF